MELRRSWGKLRGSWGNSGEVKGSSRIFEEVRKFRIISGNFKQVKGISRKLEELLGRNLGEVGEISGKFEKL